MEKHGENAPAEDPRAPVGGKDGLISPAAMLEIQALAVDAMKEFDKDGKGQASIAAKLAKIRGAIGRIPKNGHNRFQNYKYAENDDIMDVVRPLMAKHSIDLSCELVKTEWSIRKSGKGGDMHRCVALWRMTWWCGDTGASRSHVWPSEAEDSLDKSLNKAATAASKYFLIKALNISTGDKTYEPGDAADSDSGEPSRKPPQSKAPAKGEAPKGDPSAMINAYAKRIDAAKQPEDLRKIAAELSKYPDVKKELRPRYNKAMSDLRGAS